MTTKELPVEYLYQRNDEARKRIAYYQAKLTHVEEAKAFEEWVFSNQKMEQLELKYYGQKQT